MGRFKIELEGPFDGDEALRLRQQIAPHARRIYESHGERSQRDAPIRIDLDENLGKKRRRTVGDSELKTTIHVDGSLVGRVKKAIAELNDSREPASKIKPTRWSHYNILPDKDKKK